MKIFKRVYITIAVIIVLFAIINVLPVNKYDDTNIWRKESNENRPLVIAHAGGKGLYPGNTMSAFLYSYNLGVDVLELDVHLTSDNILVTRHGENNTGNIRKMSNCNTVIWEETYDWLYDNCNFGYNYENADEEFPYRDMTHEEWVEADVYMMKLEELFIEFGDDSLYIIEIKADADAPREKTADVLVALIEEYDLLDQVVVATSFEDINDYVSETYPNVTQSASHDDAQTLILHSYSLTSLFYKPNNISSLQIPISSGVPIINELDLSTTLLVNTAHKHNLAIHYWTINDPVEMRRLLDLGADGIVTDYPELLIEVINEYLLPVNTFT